jgi:hypothetical protein
VAHGEPTTQLGAPPRDADETTQLRHEEPPDSGHEGGHR